MAWFRKRPKPVQSFEAHASKGLYDLHAHLLWGVDDGASTIDESSNMLDRLSSLGFVQAACTPHFDNRRAEPSEAVQLSMIQKMAEHRGERGPRMVVGAEIIFDDLFFNKEAEGRIPGINGHPIYLVEFGFLPSSVPIGAEDRIFRFHMKEKQLILAHPERIPDLQRDVGKADALRRAGMLFQLDVMSLAGKYGHMAKRTAQLMLDREMVDLAATDMHRERDFDTLVNAMELLLDIDEGLFEKLFSTTPSLIHEGRVDEI